MMILIKKKYILKYEKKNEMTDQGTIYKEKYGTT